MMTMSDLLAEARTAYHRLQTGAAEVEIRAASGETVRYAAVDIGRLEGYIARLEAQAARETGARRARSIKVFY